MMKIPKFENENEEREFWATHSPLDYVEMSKARRVEFTQIAKLAETSFNEWDNEEDAAYDKL